MMRQKELGMTSPFYQSITEFIFIEHQPKRADLIFVPGGSYPEAAVYAASLYHQGYAPYVLPSGKYSKPVGHFIRPEGVEEEYASEWAYLSAILKKEGVPQEAILKEDQATFTWENAIFSRRLLEHRHMVPQIALLVCQAFHARRALIYYQQQFPETEILVCPVITKGITRENWFLDQEKTNVVLGELERCGQQFHCMLPLREQNE